MTERPVKRPALHAMGRWKWLAITLLVFTCAMITPYVLMADGHNAHAANPIEARLADCPFFYSVSLSDEKTTVAARLDPTCSPTLTVPTLVALVGDGEEGATASFRGNPNDLKARLETSAFQALRVEAKTADGTLQTLLLELSPRASDQPSR